MIFIYSTISLLFFFTSSFSNIVFPPSIDIDNERGFSKIFYPYYVELLSVNSISNSLVNYRD